MLIHRDALVETTNEIIKGPENTDQSQTHLTCLPAISDDLQFMEGLKAEACQTPSGSHQSSILPDAMRYANLVLFATNANAFILLPTSDEAGGFLFAAMTE